MKLNIEIKDAYELSTHTDLKTTTYSYDINDPQSAEDTYNNEPYNYPDLYNRYYSNEVWGGTSYSGPGNTLYFYSMDREGFTNSSSFTVRLPGSNLNVGLVKEDSYNNTSTFFFDLLGSIVEENLTYNIYNALNVDGVELAEIYDRANINLRYVTPVPSTENPSNLSNYLQYGYINSSTGTVSNVLSPDYFLNYLDPSLFNIDLSGGKVPIPSLSTGSFCYGWGWFSANVYAECIKVCRDQNDNIKYYYNDGNLGFYPNSVYTDTPYLVDFRFLAEKTTFNHPFYLSMFSFKTRDVTSYVGEEEITTTYASHDPQQFNCGMYGFLQSYKKFKQQYVENDVSTHIWPGINACNLGSLVYDVPLPTIQGSYYYVPIGNNNNNITGYYGYGIVDIDKCEELCQQIEERARRAVSQIRLIPAWDEENTKVYSKGDVTVTRTSEETSTVLPY